MDSEDVSFDTIAKSVLEKCVHTRDELGELHGRDDLVSMRHSGIQLYYGLAEGSIIIQGRPYSLLSPSDEADLLEMLEARSRDGLSVAEAIILRKLKLQRVCVAFFSLGITLSQFQHMRTYNLPLPVLRPKITSAITGLPSARKPPEPDPEVLKALYSVQTTAYKSSFLSRLNGFSVRRGVPVVAVDWEAQSPWMDLMEDIRAHYALKLYAPLVLES